MIDFKENLLNHYKKYPRLKIEDIFKFIYQGAFGCEHMVPSLDIATERIIKEHSLCFDNEYPCIENLNQDFCRVNLSCLSLGLSPQTLGKLFYLSARKETKGKEALEKMINATMELIKEGLLPFTLEEFEKRSQEWKKQGYCSLHHSTTFHSLYNPQYRVISKEYIPLLPLLTKIDTILKEKNLTLAIDGGSASGKTTLSSVLSQIYDATIFHMDDFFLTPQMRTQERLSEVGGNVDHERFLSEVLLPLSQAKKIKYRAFDCSTQGFKEEITVYPKSLVIIEGAYSMHLNLEKYYDLSVFLDIDKDLQKKRILKRNTKEFAKRFFEEWIPLEEIYFEKTDIKNRCEIIIKI